LTSWTDESKHKGAAYPNDDIIKTEERFLGEKLRRGHTLKIHALVWFGDVIEKLLTKHHVHQHEVKEVLHGKPRFLFVEKGNRPDEDVYAAMGKTSQGRRLIVFFVYTRGGRAIIVSARDMTKVERRRYEEK
jgi:uncharacterized DUF497 family protein